MIVDNGEYYLYRHIRLDTNSVFYVGIGKKTPLHIKNNVYYRAYSKSSRNAHWKHIIQQTPYTVEIILESNDRFFILKKEIEFIGLYGRKDINTGELVNLTNGGDNGLNKSKDAIKRQLETSKKNGSYEKTINRIKQYSFKKNTPNNISAKKTYLYDINGNFIGEFRTRKEAGAHIKSSGDHITKMIRLNISHKGIIASNNYLGGKCNVTNFKILNPHEKTTVQLSYDGTTIINTFKSLSLAARHLGITKENLSTSIRKGHRKYGYYWKHI